MCRLYNQDGHGSSKQEEKNTVMGTCMILLDVIFSLVGLWSMNSIILVNT